MVSEPIPNELLLEIFSWLPLKSMVAARGVNRLWRELVPSSDILLDRRELYDLFMSMVHSQTLKTELLPKPLPFDREKYLTDLAKTIPDAELPKEFSLWIREWPSRLVMDWIWPSLPEKSNIRPIIKCPPASNEIYWEERKTVGQKIVCATLEMRGLEVAGHGCGWTTWLILSGPKKDILGRICVLEGESYYEGEESGGWLSALTWTEWLKKRFERSEKDISEWTPKLGTYSSD